MSSESGVLSVADEGMAEALTALLGKYGVDLERVPSGGEIPGSYWGAPEAGVVGRRVYARGDTPVHSVLHEAGHIICASPERRARLHRDAGSDDLEEAAVCYLQVTLADHVPGLGAERLMRDMDRWGYSFRLGSSALWYREDASDARAWLEAAGLIDARGQPLWSVRATADPGGRAAGR